MPLEWPTETVSAPDQVEPWFQTQSNYVLPAPPRFHKPAPGFGSPAGGRVSPIPPIAGPQSGQRSADRPPESQTDKISCRSDAKGCSPFHFPPPNRKGQLPGVPPNPGRPGRASGTGYGGLCCGRVWRDCAVWGQRIHHREAPEALADGRAAADLYAGHGLCHVLDMKPQMAPEAKGSL
jgi:hypothetical protein